MESEAYDQHGRSYTLSHRANSCSLISLGTTSRTPVGRGTLDNWLANIVCLLQVGPF